MQYQNLRMQHSEKVMKYLNLVKDLENKLKAVRKVVGDAEKNRIMICGIRVEYVVIVGVVCPTDTFLQD